MDFRKFASSPVPTAPTGDPKPTIPVEVVNFTKALVEGKCRMSYSAFHQLLVKVGVLKDGSKQNECFPLLDSLSVETQWVVTRGNGTYSPNIFFHLRKMGLDMNAIKEYPVFDPTQTLAAFDAWKKEQPTGTQVNTTA